MNLRLKGILGGSRRDDREPHERGQLRNIREILGGPVSSWADVERLYEEARSDRESMFDRFDKGLRLLQRIVVVLVLLYVGFGAVATVNNAHRITDNNRRVADNQRRIAENKRLTADNQRRIEEVQESRHDNALNQCEAMNAQHRRAHAKLELLTSRIPHPRLTRQQKAAQQKLLNEFTDAFAPSYERRVHGKRIDRCPARANALTSAPSAESSRPPASP